MSQDKGCDPLFACLGQLRTQWTLTLAGGLRKEAAAAYGRFCRQHPSLVSRVRLLPHRHDPAALRLLYSQADLVLSLCLRDEMANCALEAMACARPVLATAVGGLSELIEHGRTGYLLDTAHLAGLASTLDGILIDPRRGEIGVAARRHVRERHRPEQEKDLYRELLVSLAARS